MYDFQLVLMVAQYSQKDPKEYLPFLRELRALDTHEQRFRIDDHLGRRDRALRNLAAAGPERFEDASSYLARYELYDEAFKLYRDDAERLPAIHELYGDYLYDRREFHDAAICKFSAAKIGTDVFQHTLWPANTSVPSRRTNAHTLGESCLPSPRSRSSQMRRLLAWSSASQVSCSLEMSAHKTDHLSSRGRHGEAAQIFVDYANDIDSAVDVACRGSEFSEAYRIVRS